MSVSSLVYNATTDDTQSPQGYVLNQLSQKTKQSLEDCNAVVDGLYDRLNQDRPNIKFKALRCIKYLCENGNQAFKSTWQRRSELIRNAVHYSGNPDPIYGDALFKKVRDQAKATMASLHSNTARSTTKLASRIKGMGSQAVSGPEVEKEDDSFRPTVATPSTAQGTYNMTHNKPPPQVHAPAAPGRKQMQGFGSRQPARDDGMMGQVTNQVNQVMSGMTNLFGVTGAEKPIPPWQQKTQANYDPRLDTMRDQAKMGTGRLEALDTSKARATKKRAKRQVGGMWGNTADTPARKATDPSDGLMGNAVGSDASPNVNNATYAMQSTTSSSQPVQRQVEEDRSDGVAEGRLIDRLVHSGGRGANIGSADVSKFLIQYKTLDQLTICEFLDDKLEGGEWKQEQKALQLLDAILNKTKGKGREVAKTYFTENSDGWQELQTATKKATAKKANKIAKALGFSATEVPKIAKNRRRPTPEPQGSLLDFGTPTQSPQPLTQAVAPSGGGSGGLDLLAFGAPTTNTAAPNPAPTNSILDFSAPVATATTNPPASNTAAPTGFVDPFGMMNSGPATQPMAFEPSDAPTTFTAQTNQAGAQQQSGGFGMFATNTQPQPTTTTTNTTNIFGSFGNPQPTNPVNNSAIGFGLNSQTAMPNTQSNNMNTFGIVQPQQPQQQPARSTFPIGGGGSDPFSGLMGNSPGGTVQAAQPKRAMAQKPASDPFASLNMF